LIPLAPRGKVSLDPFSGFALSTRPPRVRRTQSRLDHERRLVY